MAWYPGKLVSGIRGRRQEIPASSPGSSLLANKLLRNLEGLRSALLVMESEVKIGTSDAADFAAGNIESFDFVWDDIKSALPRYYRALKAEGK